MNSARLMLFSTERQDTNIGNFYLCARNSTEIIKLEGKPNKSLTWNNNDLAGTAIVSKTLAVNGYIQFASGLMIQWLEDYNFPDLTARSFPIIWPSNYLFTVIGTVKTTRYHNEDKQIINAEANFTYSLNLATRGNANEYLGRVTKMNLTTSELSVVTDIRCAIFALGK